MPLKALRAEAAGGFIYQRMHEHRLPRRAEAIGTCLAYLPRYFG
jgi:hypothetical protein